MNTSECSRDSTKTLLQDRDTIQELGQTINISHYTMSFVTKLRNAISADQDVKLDNIDLTNSTSITINDTDSFKLKDNSGFTDAKGVEYDVKSIYFSWLSKDDTTTDYIKKCNDNNITIVSFVDRTELDPYLKGDIETSSRLAGGEADKVAETLEETPATAETTEDKATEVKEQAASKLKTIPTGPKEHSSAKSHSSSSSSHTKEKKHAAAEVDKIDYKESKRRKLESDPLLKCISIHEIELIDHDKALRGTQKSNDFSNLIRECEYKIVRPLKASAKGVKPSTSTTTSTSKIPSKPASSSSSKSSSSASKLSSSSSSSKVKSATPESQSLSIILQKRDPIIILSPSAISMLTMGNIKPFLQDGKFVDVHTHPDNADENSVSNMLQIVRQSKKFNRKIKFLVVNNVEKFFVKPEYWDRVVAVFTTGQEWQFKNYKINKPNLLFQKVKGFYVNYNGDTVPTNVKNWNVQVISLDRNQRFKDRQISELLWEAIERFMLSRGYK